MTNDIGQQLVDLQQRMARMERASRLGSASLDGTPLQVLDPTSGGLRGIIGQQPDGTTAVTITNGAAPPAPSTPTVAPALGGIAVTWDGTLADSAVLPLDWARIEVHASDTDGFTPAPETLKATIETPQGATVYLSATVAQYVVLLARNTSGTASAPSAQAGPYEPRAVVGTDIADGSITETLIADDAITTPKLRAGAVEADKMAANSVTTAALSAGCVDATALKADAITGKTITGGTVTGAVVQTAPTGQRMVLDDDGAIKVFDADGNPTNYIGGPDNIAWNVAGWAPDGTPDGQFVGMWSGNFILGQGDPQTQSVGTMGILGVTTDYGMTLQSPAEPSASGAFENHAFVNLLSGKSSGAHGTVNAAQMQVSGDLGVSGAVVMLTNEFDTDAWRSVPEVWHVVGGSSQPAYNTGWAAGSSSGTYQSLQYRVDAEDNLHIVGVFHATGASPSATVFTLPTTTNTSGFSTPNWRPKIAQRLPLASFVTSITPLGSNAEMLINSSGVVQVYSSAAIAANQNFCVNAKVPLGNIA